VIVLHFSLQGGRGVIVGVRGWFRIVDPCLFDFKFEGPNKGLRVFLTKGVQTDRLEDDEIVAVFVRSGSADCVDDLSLLEAIQGADGVERACHDQDDVGPRDAALRFELAPHAVNIIISVSL
jgi:hypothetical protein